MGHRDGDDGNQGVDLIQLAERWRVAGRTLRAKNPKVFLLRLLAFESAIAEDESDEETGESALL